MRNDQGMIGPFLPAGTTVRYDGLVEGGPEFGIVVHCWMNEDIGAYDCYVAFFGSELPDGPPNAASSRNVIEK
jgi:hypothetical protein